MEIKWNLTSLRKKQPTDFKLIPGQSGQAFRFAEGFRVLLPSEPEQPGNETREKMQRLLLLS